MIVEKKKILLGKVLSLITWVIRIALAVIYILLVNYRGWVVWIVILCLIPIDIAIKRKWHVVLDIGLVIFFVLLWFPWFVPRTGLHFVHFYLLQNEYEKTAERYMDASEYEFIKSVDYDGQELEEKQILTYPQKQSGISYGINESEKYLYDSIYVNEKEDGKAVFFMVNAVDLSGYMYVPNEETRKMLGIEAPYGIGAKCGYCIPEYLDMDVGGVEPYKYRWINKHWLFWIECVS